MLAPSCLTDDAGLPPAPSPTPIVPVVEERFIIIERTQNLVRIRLKKIDRPFLLPIEIEQIKKELRELTTEERELLRRLMEQLYGAPRAPVPQALI